MDLKKKLGEWGILKLNEIDSSKEVRGAVIAIDEDVEEHLNLLVLVSDLYNDVFLDELSIKGYDSVSFTVEHQLRFASDTMSVKDISELNDACSYALWVNEEDFR